MLPISLDTFLNDLSARVGVQYTDEQRAFMRDFTSPIISFSSPGTGKTKSAIGGLLTAELYHQVPGNQIYALSFTNMSTGELKVRHKQDCEKVGIKQTVNFQTLHSLCSSILKANYKLLGIGKLTVVDTISIEDQAGLLMDISKDKGISLHPWQIRPFINAVRSLNSSLVFDRSHVESKYAFKQCRMPYEDFTTLRKFLYLYTKMTDTLQVQDILIYTLELLLSHPEVSAEFKSRCRILLVDDNDLNREIAITLLEDEGFTVECAVNGCEAVEKIMDAPSGHYQLVLMDVQMPVMNGYEATKAIRRLNDPTRAQVPILAMTADAFEEDRQKALRSGMNGHLTKPVEIDKLFKALDELLS